MLPVQHLVGALHSLKTVAEKSAIILQNSHQCRKHAAGEKTTSEHSRHINVSRQGMKWYLDGHFHSTNYYYYYKIIYIDHFRITASWPGDRIRRPEHPTENEVRRRICDESV